MIEPLNIQSDVPAPERRYALSGDMTALRTLLKTMKVGESFIWNKKNRHPYLAAKQVGIIITTRRLVNGTLRIWRRQ